MEKVLSVVFIVLSSLVFATDEVDVVIDEIFFLHDAETLWSEYATNSVDQRRESLVYPELYREELDSWLANELSWNNVEPLFRSKLKSQYTVDQLIEIAESLRQSPSGYPDESGEKRYGTDLFNIGVAVAQTVYPPLNARLVELRELYEPELGTDVSESLGTSEGTRVSLPIPEIEVH